MQRRSFLSWCGATLAALSLLRRNSWAAVTQAPIGPEFGSIETQDFSIKWKVAASNSPGDFTSLQSRMGRVNSAPFRGHPAGTLMLQSFSIFHRDDEGVLRVGITLRRIYRMSWVELIRSTGEGSCTGDTRWNQIITEFDFDKLGIPDGTAFQSLPSQFSPADRLTRSMCPMEQSRLFWRTLGHLSQEEQHS